MYKFKKQYENDSVVFKGRLITKRTLTTALAEDLLKVPSLAHRIEKVEDVQEVAAPVKVEKKPRKKRKNGK